MKLKEIIVDADFCIKVGASSKYRYLEKVLPKLAEKIYINKEVYDEIKYPSCAKEQIDALIQKEVLVLVDKGHLAPLEKKIYQGIVDSLARAMCNPKMPRKNWGEVCSLAMAKTKTIPYFATDERDLQPIIDKLLNIGEEHDIICVRIEDVILKMKAGEITGFKRKEAKVLWSLAGKKKDVFDDDIWPAEF